MKRIILTFIIIFSSFVSIAQVKYFDGSLNNAVTKAKKENKLVLIMASATW